MNKNDFIMQFVLVRVAMTKTEYVKEAAEDAAKLWDALHTLPAELTSQPLEWVEDELGDTECAEKANVGVFELSFDYDHASGTKKTPSLWRAGLYNADTDLVAETRFEAADSNEAKLKTVEWARKLFGDAFAALK